MNRREKLESLLGYSEPKAGKEVIRFKYNREAHYGFMEGVQWSHERLAPLHKCLLDCVSSAENYAYGPNMHTEKAKEKLEDALTTLDTLIQGEK